MAVKHSAPPFPAKHREHREQIGETQHLCGFAGHRAPGTDREHIGNRTGTLIHITPALPLTTTAPATPPRQPAHFAGMRREGTSPGASSSRRVHLWITFQTCTHTYLLKKRAVWTSSQAHDSQRVFPIMCNTCSITHIRQRALCKQSVLYRLYSAHYRENQVS